MPLPAEQQRAIEQGAEHLENGNGTLPVNVPREPVTRVRNEKPQPPVLITRAKEPEVENTDELLDRLFG